MELSIRSVSTPTSSTQETLSAKASRGNIRDNVEDLLALIIALNSGEHSSLLGDMIVDAVISEILNSHTYSKAMSLRTEAASQQDTCVMPSIYFVTERCPPISCCGQISTQEQSTALSRPRRLFVQAAIGHGHSAFNINSTVALGGCLSSHELAYNRRSPRDESKTHDLMAEIEFLRKSLCSLLLQPVTASESRKQRQPPGADAVRDVEADTTPAETEMEEQISGPRMSKYPMTEGNYEIQAVKEAVKEASNTILSLKNNIRNPPSELIQYQQTLVHKNLEGLNREILRFPDELISILVRRKAELEAIRRDRDAAARTLRAAEDIMAAAEARQMEMVAGTEASEQYKNLANENMREAAELMRAVEAREKLVAGRERMVVRQEEEQALEDLNHGANAALEDLAEAAAAETRQSERSTGSIIGFNAAVENETFPTDFGKRYHSPPAGEHVLTGRDTAIAAKEEELSQREDNLVFRETNLHHRETALFAREQILEQMKFAQFQLAENWKVQVDTWYADLEAKGEDLGVKFRTLIALKGRVEETQAKVRSLIGEAKGMVSVSSGDEGEGKGA